MKDAIAADVTKENRRYIFENFTEHNVFLRPGAKVGQFYTDGVDYTLADRTVGSLRGYDNIVLTMGSRANAALKDTCEKLRLRWSLSERAIAPPATPSFPQVMH